MTITNTLKSFITHVLFNVVELLDGSDMNANAMFMKLGANSSSTKRGVLPKHATQIMKSWLFQHIVVSEIMSATCFVPHIT